MAFFVVGAIVLGVALNWWILAAATLIGVAVTATRWRRIDAQPDAVILVPMLPVRRARRIPRAMISSIELSDLRRSRNAPEVVQICPAGMEAVSVPALYGASYFAPALSGAGLVSVLQGRKA